MFTLPGFPVLFDPPKPNVVETIASLKTSVFQGTEMVLSISLKGGSNVKYLIKSHQADALEAARKKGIFKRESLIIRDFTIWHGLDIGKSPLPLGLALKIAN